LRNEGIRQTNFRKLIKIFISLSERYNRLIQLRVFAFCVNILHAYITGPIIYQNDDSPLLAPGTFTGWPSILFEGIHYSNVM
jgi:hypothetical protein